MSTEHEWGMTFNLDSYNDAHWLIVYHQCTGGSPPSDESFEGFKKAMKDELNKYSGIERVSRVFELWDMTGFLPVQTLEKILAEKDAAQVPQPPGGPTTTA